MLYLYLCLQDDNKSEEGIKIRNDKNAYLFNSDFAVFDYESINVKQTVAESDIFYGKEFIYGDDAYIYDEESEKLVFFDEENRESYECYGDDGERVLEKDYLATVNRDNANHEDYFRTQQPVSYALCSSFKNESVESFRENDDNVSGYDDDDDDDDGNATVLYHCSQKAYDLVERMMLSLITLSESKKRGSFAKHSLLFEILRQFFFEKEVILLTEERLFFHFDEITCMDLESFAFLKDMIVAEFSEDQCLVIYALRNMDPDWMDCNDFDADFDVFNVDANNVESGGDEDRDDEEGKNRAIILGSLQTLCYDSWT